MKTLVVYDSLYGNTEKIARAIGDALGEDVPMLFTSDVSADDLIGLDCLVVGAPTHGGGPSEPMKAFLLTIPETSLKGVKAAAFDTRLPETFLKVFTYGASRISNALKRAGADVVAQPEGFFVLDYEGPLADGELERAAAWAEQIRQSN